MNGGLQSPGTSDETQRSPWNSLEIAKLMASFATPILVLILGSQINESLRGADIAREQAAQTLEQSQKELEEARALSQARQLAVGSFSRFIYERRTRAELIVSAFRRHADYPTDQMMQEILERKRLYDDAYFNWNANHQANLLLVRQILGSDRYSSFEDIVETRLVNQTFRPLDRCITYAYDVATRRGNAELILDGYGAKGLLQRALDCGYVITDQLFVISSPSDLSVMPRAVIDSRCPNLGY